MTFISENVKLFLDETEPLKPLKRRSEGRLKTYRSTEDLRAWNYKVEDRRQQILDLVNRDVDECPGYLVRVISKFFSDKYKRDLKKCCRLLWKFIKQLPLACDDQIRLRCLETQLGRFFVQVIEGCTCAGEFGLICVCRGKRELKCVCGESHCVCGSDQQKISGTLGSYKVKSSGPVRLVTTIRGIKPGLEVPCEALAVKAQCCPNKLVRVVKNVQPEKEECNCTDNVDKIVTLKIFGGSRSGSSSRQARSTTSVGTRTESSSSADKRVCRNVKNTQFIYSLYEQAATSQKDIVASSTKTAKNSDSEEYVRRLQDALEEREYLCEEQQKNIDYLRIEKDKLNDKIQECLTELETLKQINKKKQHEKVSTIMGMGEEGQSIKEELEALKKYCVQLRETESENEKLKRERDLLKRQLEMPSVSILPTFSRSILEEKSLNEVKKERDSLKKKTKVLEQELIQLKSVPHDLEIYKDRSDMLDNTLAERDEMLRNLDQMNEMQKELDTYKRKAERVDELEKTLKTLKSDKSSDYDLRKAKSQCLCLEKELDNLKTERDALKRRIDFLMNEQECLRVKAKEAEVVKVERDKLQIKVNDLAHVQMHNENLMLKCKSLESASKEGHMYKQKYEELLVMECECQTWKIEVEAAEHVKRERDCLRKQVTDLQSVIVEQEKEIKNLTQQLETVIKRKDETQMRMREALTSMRDEIEKKDSLIVASEEKLEKVQAELKSSIQGVACETICYKTRLEELENELDHAKEKILKLESEFKEHGIDKCSRSPSRICKSECDSLTAMKRELDAAKVENRKLQDIAKKMVSLTGDEHVQKMLKHSESAMKKVVAELSKQYKEWDHYKKERRRSRSRSYDRSVYFEGAETAQIGDLQEIHGQRENNVQGNPCTGLCQGEMIALKLKNAHWLDRLQKKSSANDTT